MFKGGCDHKEVLTFMFQNIMKYGLIMVDYTGGEYPWLSWPVFHKMKQLISWTDVKIVMFFLLLVSTSGENVTLPVA